MKKLIYLLIAVTMVSCYEDIGNYKYNELEPITINNIPETLGDLILLEDTIKLNPIVGPEEQDKSNQFNYYWSLKKGTGSSAKLERFSTEKELVLPVTMAGEITLRFEVEDKKTGIIKSKLVSGRGVSRMSSGMYILKETSDGNTELDMIGFNTQTGESIKYPNLISVLNNGQPLAGKPVTIDYWGYRKEDFDLKKLVAVPGLRIASKEDIMVVNTDDFSVLTRFKDMFLGDVPAVRNIQFLKSIPSNCLLMNDGKLYAFTTYSQSIASSGVITEYGGNRFLPAMVGNFNVSPKIAWNPTATGTVFFMYDNVSGLFKYTNSTVSSPRNVTESGTTSNFKTDFNSDLIFMHSTGGIYVTNTFALMRSKTDPNVLTFLDMNTGGLNTGLLRYSTGATKVTLNAANLKIDDAKMWAVHPNAKIIYFVYNNELWSFSYTSIGGAVETRIKTLSDEVTYLDVRNEYYVTGASVTSKLFTYFVIATANGNEYKLEKYDVVAGDVPSATPNFTATGTGIIRDYLYIKPDNSPSWMRLKK